MMLLQTSEPKPVTAPVETRSGEGLMVSAYIVLWVLLMG